MLHSVVGRGPSARLLISPVQAKAVTPSGQTRIFCPEEGWAFTATSTVALDARTLSVGIASGVLARIPARTSRHQTASDRPLLLVVPRGIGEVHVLPVVDVGAEIVAVDSPVGLRPGETLASVDLWADRGCIRHADAEVLDSAPWYDLAGRARFRLRLRLRTAEARGTTGYDLLSDPAKIQRLFELTSLLESEGTFADGTAVSVETLAEDHVVLHARGLLGPLETARRTLRFQLFDVSYEADVRVIDRTGAKLSIAWPVVVRRFRQRSESRTLVRDRSVRIEYVDALSGELRAREVLDLSFGGARFAIERATDVLWEEMPLASAALRWGTKTLPLGRVRVRGAADGTCRVSFDDNLADDPQLGELLTTLRHPDLVVQDGSDFDRPYALFKRVELLEDFMVEGVDARLDEVRDNWRRLHTSPDICRSVMRREGDDAVAWVSSVQAWPGTWIGQHMAALPGRRGCTPGLLFSAYLDHVLLRADCRFMAIFTSTENGRINDMHRRFNELTGTSEAFSEARFEVWRVPPGFSSPRNLSPAQMASGHHTLIARAAQRTLGVMPATALGLTDSQIEFPELAGKFDAAGLLRSRQSRVVVERGTPRVAVLHENTSVGANLTGMLDATWLLPLHQNRGRGGGERDGPGRGPADPRGTGRAPGDDTGRLRRGHAGRARAPAPRRRGLLRAQPGRAPTLRPLRHRHLRRVQRAPT